MTHTHGSLIQLFLLNSNLFLPADFFESRSVLMFLRFSVSTMQKGPAKNKSRETAQLEGIIQIQNQQGPDHCNLRQLRRSFRSGLLREILQCAGLGNDGTNAPNETRNPHRVWMPHSAEVPFGAVNLLRLSPVWCVLCLYIYMSKTCFCRVRKDTEASW